MLFAMISFCQSLYLNSRDKMDVVSLPVLPVWLQDETAHGHVVLSVPVE